MVAAPSQCSFGESGTYSSSTTTSWSIFGGSTLPNWFGVSLGTSVVSQTQV